MSEQPKLENEQLLEELRWLWDLVAVKFAPSSYCLNKEEQRRIAAIGALTSKHSKK